MYETNPSPHLSRINRSKSWALVTGGSSGIGRECVRQLILQQNHRVVFTYRSSSNQAEALVNELKQQHPDCEIEFYQLDLAKEESIKGFVDQLKIKGHRFDIVIHCAGIGTATVKTQLHPHDKSGNEILTFLRVNALGPFELQEALDPLLVDEGDGTGILFVGSVGGGDRPVVESSPGDTASKAYLGFRLKDFAARNLKTHRHIVGLNPGATDTSMFQQSTLNKMDKQERARFEENLPKRRVFSPEIVAKAIIHHVDPSMAILYHGACISASAGLCLHYAPLAT